MYGKLIVMFITNSHKNSALSGAAEVSLKSGLQILQRIPQESLTL